MTAQTPDMGVKLQTRTSQPIPLGPSQMVVGRPLFSDCPLHTVFILPVALHAQCPVEQEDDIPKPNERNKTTKSAPCCLWSDLCCSLAHRAQFWRAQIPCFPGKGDQRQDAEEGWKRVRQSKTASVGAHQPAPRYKTSTRRVEC